MCDAVLGHPILFRDVVDEDSEEGAAAEAADGEAGDEPLANRLNHLLVSGIRS